MMKTLAPYLALYRRHFWRLTLGIILAIITLLASIGLLTLSGWFLAASSLAGIAGITTFNYMLPAAGVRGAAIMRTAARYFERLVSHDGTFRVLEHLRVFTFNKLFPLSPSGITQFHKGDLLNRLVADVDTLDHLYLRIISPLAGALVVIGVVTVGLNILDTQLALMIGSVMLITVLILPPLFYHLGRHSGAQMTRQRGQYRLQLTRWLQCQAELQLYGMESRSRKAMDDTEKSWLNAQRRQASLSGLSMALLLLISGATVTAVLWFSAGGIGDFSSPAALIALFVFCTLAAFEALAPVGGAFQHLGQVLTAAHRLSDVIMQTPSVEFPSAMPAASSDEKVILAMENVTFRYQPERPAALKALSLKVSRGQHIALLGRTGCGKSTLLQLLTRAWDPDSGSITLQGIALSQWDEASLRQSTSVVTQRVHLFNATLRENLLVATQTFCEDDGLIAVLHKVGLTTLLDNDEGLNAWLGEGGRALSGGELRRLALARALLHDAPLLLLDEPTEGLDATTEQHILALLRQIAKDKTVIMVTHRLHGLEHFDQIYLLDEGMIVEQGTHNMLLAQRARYWSFHQQLALTQH
ncbi:MAG: Lipid A export ATP-binding/permease protein MsbA [Candidatus Erwinia impunctatus]|nr:Lipid A export ATP-binding/permease protein MsbA [Culicoides impunctatus]